MAGKQDLQNKKHKGERDWVGAINEKKNHGKNFVIKEEPSALRSDEQYWWHGGLWRFSIGWREQDRKDKDKSYRGNASESKSAKTKTNVNMNNWKQEQHYASKNTWKQARMNARTNTIKEEQTKQATMIKSKQKLMNSRNKQKSGKKQSQAKNKQKQEQPYAIKNKWKRAKMEKKNKQKTSKYETKAIKMVRANGIKTKASKYKATTEKSNRQTNQVLWYIYRALWGDRGEVERRSPKPWCLFQAQAGAGPFQTVAVLLTPLSLRSSVTVIPWALITWPQTAGRSPRIALTNKINTENHNTQNTDYYFIDQWMPSG